MLDDAAKRQIENDPAISRYSRQVFFEQIDQPGQARLSESTVLIVGCGGLGTALSNALVRAGVGRLRVADRDYIEMNNLQRQVLFDEEDVRQGLPKAEAAARKLGKINSEVTIEPIVDHVDATNIRSLAADADLVLDGTDNFDTRFLINDLAVSMNQPWVYGACVASQGLVLPIIPGQTPCLRCVFEDGPPPAQMSTCDVVGIISPAVAVTAAYQTSAALQILTGQLDALDRHLLSFDVWSHRTRRISIDRLREESDCPCCKQRRFEYLEQSGDVTTVQCGRRAYQLKPGQTGQLDLVDVATRAQAAGAGIEIRSDFLLQFRAGDIGLTLFPDGRAIVKGASDAETARAFYHMYVDPDQRVSSHATE